MHVTQEQLRKLLLDAGLAPEVVQRIDPDLPLVNQDVDSVDFPAFLAAIESQLKVTIGDNEAYALKTLRDFEARLNR